MTDTANRLPTALMVAFAAVALVIASGGAQLKLAFEDRFDPQPRQMSLGMQVAGVCLGLAVSWTRRAPVPN